MQNELKKKPQHLYVGMREKKIEKRAQFEDEWKDQKTKNKTQQHWITQTVTYTHTHTGTANKMDEAKKIKEVKCRAETTK